MVIELERECSASPFQGTKTSARPKSLPSRRWFVPAGIAASIALAIGVSVRTMAPEKVSVFQYATNVGEIRVVSLDDGSTVTLGASTMIEGRFSKQSREIELNRGRAFFDVTSDSGRPFRVAASKSQIEVVGTAFDVEYGPEAIQVSVQHGRVNVASVSTSPSSITAGMQLRASLAGINGEPTEFDINSLSWRSGRLAYIDARLEDVISEVNRYRSQKIQIADSEIEDLRVSFSIAADQTDVLLAGLEATLPIRVTYAGGGAILHLDDSR